MYGSSLQHMQHHLDHAQIKKQMITISYIKQLNPKIYKLRSYVYDIKQIPYPCLWLAICM